MISIVLLTLIGSDPLGAPAALSQCDREALKTGIWSVALRTNSELSSAYARSSPDGGVIPICWSGELGADPCSLRNEVAARVEVFFDKKWNSFRVLRARVGLPEAGNQRLGADLDLNATCTAKGWRFWSVVSSVRHEVEVFNVADGGFSSHKERGP